MEWYDTFSRKILVFTVLFFFQSLPLNMFLIAACNPHRGNSVSTINKPSDCGKNEKWFKADYLVRPLHPSFQHLIWDFGYLEDTEENAYIESKLKQLENSLTERECQILTEKIAKSQSLLRQFTHDYLITNGANEVDSAKASSSAVSQRDIQRVLKLYIWLKDSFIRLEKYGFSPGHADQSDWHVSVRALYTALGLVYYFRLNAEYRKKYADSLDKSPNLVRITDGEVLRVSFSQTVEDELTWLIENVELPPGVANIKALRENLYMIIVCCMANIPLIITGPPGCSKTLSFKIAVANLLGEVSPKETFKHKIMKCLEPHIYQCSKHSNTDDIETLFDKKFCHQ